MTLEEQAKMYLMLILGEHRGHKQRIDRHALLEQLNRRLGWQGDGPRLIGDRKMRVLLEELRSEARGTYICGSLTGGYFMAENKQELDEYTQADLRRAAALYRRVRTQRTNARLVTPDMEDKQIRMFE